MTEVSQGLGGNGTYRGKSDGWGEGEIRSFEEGYEVARGGGTGKGDGVGVGGWRGEEGLQG